MDISELLLTEEEMAVRALNACQESSDAETPEEECNDSPVYSESSITPTDHQSEHNSDHHSEINDNISGEDISQRGASPRVATSPEILPHSEIGEDVPSNGSTGGDIDPMDTSSSQMTPSAKSDEDVSVGEVSRSVCESFDCLTSFVCTTSTPSVIHYASNVSDLPPADEKDYGLDSICSKDISCPVPVVSHNNIDPGNLVNGVFRYEDYFGPLSEQNDDVSAQFELQVEKGDNAMCIESGVGHESESGESQIVSYLEKHLTDGTLGAAMQQNQSSVSYIPVTIHENTVVPQETPDTSQELYGSLQEALESLQQETYEALQNTPCVLQDNTDTVQEIPVTMQGIPVSLQDVHEMLHIAPSSFHNEFVAHPEPSMYQQFSPHSFPFQTAGPVQDTPLDYSKRTLDAAMKSEKRKIDDVSTDKMLPVKVPKVTDSSLQDNVTIGGSGMTTDNVSHESVTIALYEAAVGMDAGEMSKMELGCDEPTGDQAMHNPKPVTLPKAHTIVGASDTSLIGHISDPKLEGPTAPTCVNTEREVDRSRENSSLSNSLPQSSILSKTDTQVVASNVHTLQTILENTSQGSLSCSDNEPKEERVKQKVIPQPSIHTDSNVQKEVPKPPSSDSRNTIQGKTCADSNLRADSSKQNVSLLQKSFPHETGVLVAASNLPTLQTIPENALQTITFADSEPAVDRSKQTISVIPKASMLPTSCVGLQAPKLSMGPQNDLQGVAQADAAPKDDRTEQTVCPSQPPNLPKNDVRTDSTDRNILSNISENNLQESTCANNESPVNGSDMSVLESALVIDIGNGPKTGNVTENNHEESVSSNKEPIQDGTKKKHCVLPTATLRESDVGICTYIGSHKGFHGIIKERYEDFVVHEINEAHEEIHLTDFSCPQDEKEAVVDVTNILSAQDSSSLDQLMNSTDKGSDHMIDVTTSSKELRTKIHMAIRQNYSSLESNTVDVNETKYIKVTKKANSGKSRVCKWPKNRPKYCRFVLSKENIDTNETLSLMAKFLRIRPHAFQYAGTKDKRAVTVQEMTIQKFDAEKLSKLNKQLRGIRLGNFRYVDKPLCLGELSGNHFEIVLRDVKGDRVEIEKALESLKERGFVNYFGMQRFGNTSVPTHHIGRAVLKNQWEEAIDLILQPKPGDDSLWRKNWAETKDARSTLALLPRSKRLSLEKQILKSLASTMNNYCQAFASIPRNSRMLYLHSYQSRVWNTVASKRIPRHEFSVNTGDLVARNSINDDNSSWICPERVEGEMVHKYSFEDVVLPLPGHSVHYPDNEAHIYKEILAEDGITMDHLKHKVKDYSLPGAYRKLVVIPKDVKWSFIKYDDATQKLIQSDMDRIEGIPEPVPQEDGSKLALKISFSLPTSAYATMALRELMKTETSSAHHALLTQENKSNEENG